MRPLRTLLVLLSLSAFASHGQADDTSAGEPDVRFKRDLGSFLDRMQADPGAPPGFAVVAIDRSGVIFERAHGTRDAASSAPMTLDTPIYTASVTKAYTGLLASILDAEGTLSLDASLKDVWPNLKLPKGMDASAISAKRLLSHTSGLQAGGLIYRSVITGEITAQEVPGHLARFAKPGGSAFAYSNTGPFVYSAMAEERTGLPWPRAMARYVFGPMHLKRTIARTEDLPGDTIAHCHVRRDGSWHSIPLKPSPVLNAAGGIYASARDTSHFLEAFLTRGASTQGRLPARVLDRTWQRVAVQDREYLGFHRDGYGLGWDLGSYGGHRFVSRSGGHTGCRALALFLPEQNFAMAVLAVGDAGANRFNAVLIQQAIDYWTGAPEAPMRVAGRLAAFSQAAADEIKQAEAMSSTSATPPDANLAKTLCGVYRHERLGDLRIEPVAGALILRAGVWQGELRHVTGDDWVLIERGSGIVEPFRVFRDHDHRVSSVVLDDDRFERVR